MPAGERESERMEEEETSRAERATLLRLGG